MGYQWALSEAILPTSPNLKGVPYDWMVGPVGNESSLNKLRSVSGFLDGLSHEIAILV